MAFTPEQLRAMNERNKSLLVSASAGSGKTTVLINRVINLVLGKQIDASGNRTDYNGGETVSLDNMVICTFTRAAAADMREKLQDALIKEENAGNLMAGRQLELLPNAEISTIHSWCQRLLKNYFYAVGLDPAFDLVDEREGKAMISETIDEVIARFIDEAHPDFVSLYEILMSHRSDDTLKEMLDGIYTFLRAQADPQLFLNETAFYGLDNPQIVADILESIRVRTLERYREPLELMISRCKQEEIVWRLDQLSSCVEVINGTTEKIEKVAGAPKKENRPSYDAVVEKFVKSFKDAVEKNKKNTAFPIANNRKFIEIIVKLISELDAEYTRKKQKKAKLDYSDLEHYTVKLFNSEVADEIRARYKYVFVDEYQDVNPLQEQIVLALTGVNQFLVGDVKQSIYAFRMCDPTIFLNKQKNYAQYGFEAPIELNANFRSKNEILDFANEVFDEVMTEKFGGVDYEKSARLTHGLEKDGGKVSLYAVVECQNEVSQGVYSVAEDEGDDATTVMLEVDAVVKNIAELVGSGVEPSDVAVLYARRSARVGMIYEKLRALGISATVSDKIRFTSVKQIGRLCKFLKYVTDERDEVALIASLKSPVANLCDEELVKIRFSNPAQKSFRLLVDEYAEKNNDEIAQKIREFTAYTKQCRQFAYTERAGDVIGKIVADKNWFKYVFALPDAKLNADTLNSFLEFAINSPYGDNIKNFVEYLESDNDDYERPPSANAVKIMTIHASKGLEFEHVFLIDVSSQFSNMDTRKKVVCDGVLGFCMSNFDEENRTIEENQLRVCAKDRISWSRKEESMRVLYVALTRPKTALYIFARVKGDDAIFTPEEYNHIDYESGNSFFDWLRPFYCRHVFTTVRGYEDTIITANASEKFAAGSYIEVDDEPIRNYLDFVSKSESVAVKKSATAIMHDEAVEENIPVNYIAGSTDDRAIEIGNAYHKAMEIISFSADFDSEWERISPTFDIGKLVDKDKLRTAHKIVGDFVKDKKWLKEQQFMYKNDENLLIQGIVDLLVIDGENFIVIDYKTSKTSTIESGIYDAQLRIYCDACAKILNLKPLTPMIYSFGEGKFFDGKLE